MTAITDRTVGKCKQCNKALLLGHEGLCICCENTSLHVVIANRDITIEQMRKKQSELYSKIIALRKEGDE